MKITCDIVRDLMPLYVDDVCSDDSRKLIEDHINHCSKCQNELAAMKDPIECPPLSEVGDSKTPFFKIRKKVRIKMIAAIISTAFLVMTAMFAIQEVGVHPQNRGYPDGNQDKNAAHGRGSFLD